MEQTIHFTIERETKGAIRYQEVDQHQGSPVPFSDCAIGILYVRKSALDKKVPQTLTVRIEATS